MDEERVTQIGEASMLPGGARWSDIKDLSGEALNATDVKLLDTLSRQPGIIGAIFLKAQNEIQDPAKLKRLVGLIDSQVWLGLNNKFSGIDIVPEVVRLAAMNLYLHGITGVESIVEAKDVLLGVGGRSYEIILTNPPFGKIQSYRIVRDDGEIDTEREDYDRQDFFVTTSNKQLNFLQHIMTVLAPTGEAAVVLPDNVLFEGGAGETIRRRMLRNFDFHTLLRLCRFGETRSLGQHSSCRTFESGPGKPAHP